LDYIESVIGIIRFEIIPIKKAAEIPAAFQFKCLCHYLIMSF
jgi:hypothetical protein